MEKINIEFSDSELDSIYKLYGTSSMVTADFELVGEGYSYVDQCKIHLTGNQKNGHRNIMEYGKDVNVGETLMANGKEFVDG